MKHLAPFLPTKWSPSSLTVEMLHDLKSFWSDLVPLAAMIQGAKRPWSELIQASDCRVAPDSNWVIGLPEAASFSGENDFLPPRSKGPLFLCLDLTPSDTDEPLGKKKTQIRNRMTSDAGDFASWPFSLKAMKAKAWRISMWWTRSESWAQGLKFTLFLCLWSLHFLNGLKLINMQPLLITGAVSYFATLDPVQKAHHVSRKFTHTPDGLQISSEKKKKCLQHRSDIALCQRLGVCSTLPPVKATSNHLAWY